MVVFSFLETQFVDSVIQGIVYHDARATAVGRQGGTDLILALEAVEGLLGGIPLPDAKDGAYCAIGVDDGGAIEWVEGHDVLTLCVQIGHLGSFLRKACVDDSSLPKRLKNEGVGLDIHV